MSNEKSNNETVTSSLPKLALTRVEAAEVLRIHPVTLDRLVKRGLINPSRGTRRPVFTIKELERHLEATQSGKALKR